MAKQTINIGASPNDGTGTPLRTSFDYCNLNFTELYTAVGPSGNNIVVPGTATITGDLTVDTSTLKVDSTNNRVGIGTASPATILDIQSAGAVYARIYNTTSTADAYLLVKNTTGEGFFGINATGPYIYTAQSLPITFTTAALERYRIAADGVATWSNVGGVAGTAMTLNATSNLVLRGGTAGANGVGVTFPAVAVPSSDANCLDDYEEGTFSPTVEGSTSAGTVTYIVRNGVYTKVGRVVQFQLHAAWNTGTGTGALRLSGLPFTSNGTYISVPNVYPIDITLAAGYYATASVQPGTSIINIYQLPVGGGSDGSVVYDPAGQLIITGTYTV